MFLKRYTRSASGLIPSHKQSVVLFLERVYGIEDRELFFRLLEFAFLPDLRAATVLDKVGRSGVHSTYPDAAWPRQAQS